MPPLPETAETTETAETDPRRPRWWQFGQPPLRYPRLYLGLIAAAAGDALLTWVVLSLGGSEANPIANAILAFYGWAGMVGFKFAMMTVVIVFCEWVGRRRDPSGRRLAIIAIAIQFIPLLAVIAQWLVYHG